MKALSLRVRVAVAVAITCIAIMIGLGVTLHTASEKLEHSLVNQIVNEEMVFLVRHYLENPNLTVSAPGPNLEYFIVRSNNDLARVPSGYRDLPVGHHEVMINHEEQHVAVREVDGTRFIVAYDAGPHEIREQRFRELLYFSLLAVTVISATLGYWVAGLITRQISRLSSRVASMDPGAPRAPLLESGQSPEVATLASALDLYQARIRALIEREQEFTGNASHELRTPLTAIRTSCELLDSEAGLSAKTRTRIAAISAAAERMTGQIEMLLLLARAETAGNLEKVSIASCVNDAVQPLLPEAAAKSVEFRNLVPADAVFALNRHALDIVITNLLRNAFMYTDRGRVSVSLENNKLIVSDTGIGIAPEQLPRIFGRFHRGGGHGDGFGLGLAIVQRVCDLHGWIIDVDSTPSQGSTFRVKLA